MTLISGLAQCIEMSIFFFFFFLNFDSDAG